MAYRFADVIVVPFPFTDQTATKKRPAVVVSSDAYNRGRPDIILMAITSQVRAAPTIGEVEVIHWQAAGLLKPSVISPSSRRSKRASSHAHSAISPLTTKGPCARSLPPSLDNRP